MQAQIDSFAAQAAVDPPAAAPAAAAPEPAAPTPAVEPPAASTDDTTVTAHDDVMAEAVDSLNGTTVAQKPSEVTAVEVAPPTTVEPPAPAPSVAPAAETPASDDAVSGGHKKIIKPITDGADAKPDINKLLAAEEAAEIARQTATVSPAPATPPTPAPEPDPALQLSPELQNAMSDNPEASAAEPAPAPETAPAAAPEATPATPPTVTEPPADPNAPNPNEIAL